MQITVVFGPWLIEDAGVKECTVEVESGSDLHRLFQLLTERYGKVFKDIASGASKQSGIVVLLNDEIVTRLDRQLSDGDEVSFAIPLSGG